MCDSWHSGQGRHIGGLPLQKVEMAGEHLRVRPGIGIGTSANVMVLTRGYVAIYVSQAVLYWPGSLSATNLTP